MQVLDKIKPKIKSKKLLFIIACLVPAFLLYIVINIIPTVDIFRMSLYEWSGMGDNMKFVGIDNFVLMFKNSSFWQSFGNTMLIMVISSILTISIALVLAFILSKMKIKGKTFFKIILYLPNILSIVVIAAIFTNVFMYDGGLFNGLLNVLGLESMVKMWLSNEKTVVGVIIFIMVWQAVGYYMIMYIAGMDGIDSAIYESASIDGADGLKKFFKITLPLTWDIIRVTLVLFVIGSINLSFLLVKTMTNGGPNGASDVLLNNMYFEAYANANYGYGMAIGVFMFVITFSLSLIIKKLTSKDMTD